MKKSENKKKSSSAHENAEKAIERERERDRMSKEADTGEKVMAIICMMTTEVHTAIKTSMCLMLTNIICQI